MWYCSLLERPEWSSTITYPRIAAFSMSGYNTLHMTEHTERCMRAINPNLLVFDCGADEQFVQGLLALKILPLDWFVDAMLQGGTVAVNSLSDIQLCCRPSDENVLQARSHFTRAVKLAFEVLDRIQNGLLPGVLDAGGAELCIRTDLRQYIFHLAEAFHCPWAPPGRQKVARPDVAKYLYEILSHMGDHNAYRCISHMYAKGHLGKPSRNSRRAAAFWMRKAHGDVFSSYLANFGESWAWKKKYIDSPNNKRFSFLFRRKLAPCLAL